jgi:hypothetical protein
MDNVLFDAKGKKRFKQLVADLQAFIKTNWVIGIIITVGALLVLIIQQIILSILNKSI